MLTERLAALEAQNRSAPHDRALYGAMRCAVRRARRRNARRALHRRRRVGRHRPAVCEQVRPPEGPRGDSRDAHALSAALAAFRRRMCTSSRPRHIDVQGASAKGRWIMLQASGYVDAQGRTDLGAPGSGFRAVPRNGTTTGSSRTFARSVCSTRRGKSITQGNRTHERIYQRDSICRLHGGADAPTIAIKDRSISPATPTTAASRALADTPPAAAACGSRRTSARCRLAHRRQGQHARACVRHDRHQRLHRHAAESAGRDAHSGRIVERLGGGCRTEARRCRARHRHRRLGSRPRRMLRRDRIEADLRTRVAARRGAATNPRSIASARLRARCACWSTRCTAIDPSIRCERRATRCSGACKVGIVAGRRRRRDPRSRRRARPTSSRIRIARASNSRDSPLPSTRVSRSSTRRHRAHSVISSRRASSARISTRVCAPRRKPPPRNSTRREQVRRDFTAAVDHALENVDVLILPTLPALPITLDEARGGHVGDRDVVADPAVQSERPSCVEPCRCRSTARR